MPKEVNRGRSMNLNFENYLMEQFAKEEPTVLDDDFPDAFDDWLCQLDVDDWLKYGDKYKELI